jgi:hypothetical protein
MTDKTAYDWLTESINLMFYCFSLSCTSAPEREEEKNPHNLKLENTCSCASAPPLMILSSFHQSALKTCQTFNHHSIG